MKLEKWLLYTIYIGVFALLLTPFIVSQGMFFPFVVAKNIFFRVITLLIVGAWGVLAIREPEYRPQKSWILWSFLAFVGSLFISNLLSPNVVKSFWSNYERMEGWVTLIHLLGLFVVMASVLNTEKLWKRFLNSSLVVSLLVSIYSIFQLTGSIAINQGGVRVDATFGNATYLAVYMLFNIFLAGFMLAWRIRERQVYTKKLVDGIGWTYISLILLNTSILYYTATRGAILGLVGGVFLVAVLVALFENKNKVIQKTGLILAGGMVVLVLGFFPLRNTSLVQNSMTLARLASISLEDATTNSRFLIWDMAFEGFKEKPVLGWGQESFIYVFSENYHPDMYGQEAWFDRAHNVFLDWLVAGGVVGAGAYLALFISAVFLLWKKKEDDEQSVLEKAILTGLLAGYFFHNLFVFDNVVSYIMFASILALISWTRVGNREVEALNQDKNIWMYKVLPVFLVLMTVYGLYFINTKAVRANKALLNALQSVSLQQFDDGLNSFKKALSYDAFSNQEVREQLIQITNNLARSGVSLDVKEQYFKLATDEMKKQIEHDPENARLYVFLGAVYEMYGFADEALFYLEKARELSPQKQNILLEIGSIKINEGKNEEGLKILKETYELAPQYETAFFAYVMAHVYAGNIDEADRLLMERMGTTLVPNDLLINAYNATGEKQRVVELLEEKIIQNPQDAQAYFSLAAAYVNVGARSDAVAILEKVKEIVPDLNDQINYYINEIKEGRNP